jgi:hypothetical protein
MPPFVDDFQHDGALHNIAQSQTKRLQHAANVFQRLPGFGLDTAGYQRIDFWQRPDLP